MKKYNKLLILFISTIVFTSCFNNNDKSENNSEEKVNTVETPVNKVYEKIADEKVGLKNATSEDLDKIIQEEIKMLNTPSSKYPFFEQLTNKKGNIEEIKKAGGMEVTRGNIYLHGLDSSVIFINDILTENEKLFSFHQDNTNNNFFYLDSSYDVFIKKIQSKYEDYEEISNQENLIDLKFKYDKNYYSVQLILPTLTSRDEFDNIFDASKKIKVNINLLK